MCNGYHRYGKENCTSHRVDEADLDRLIREELISARRQLRKAYVGIEEDVKRWLSSRDNTEKKLKALESRLEKRLEDQKEILLERLRDREHASVYTEMLSECEADISRLGKEIRTLKDHDSAVKRARSEMKDGIALLDEMLDKGEISAASLRLLVEEITIWEKDETLRIAITLKGNLRHHMDFYDEEGNLTDTAFEAMAEGSDPDEDEEYIEYLAYEAGQEPSEIAETA